MDKKEKLDKLIKECGITPVGNGYIDLICPKKYIEKFINGLSKLEIKIIGFTWWCDVTKGHNPCGMGGPKNKYGNNWYSEIQMEKIITFKNNKDFLNYLIVKWKNSSDYKECYVPGFWLKVPVDWTYNN